jgi:hypothetical protein
MRFAPKDFFQGPGRHQWVLMRGMKPIPWCPTVHCAASTQVVAPHQILGVKRQCLPKRPQACSGLLTRHNSQIWGREFLWLQFLPISEGL